MLTEFTLIDRYFTWPSDKPEIITNVGDDAALVNVNGQLAISVDTMVEGRHFTTDISPADLAYKALAVNLSDMAAMGAKPKWFTLALTIPEANETWLQAFSTQLHQTAKQYDIALIGGNMTRGPLNISIQIIGMMEKKPALLRSAAKVGDKIYVSGTIGDAGLALRMQQHKAAPSKQYHDFLFARLNRPTPRVALGQALIGLAHAAIDISDGLAADLQHILTASGVGARLEVEKLPLSAALRDTLAAPLAQQLALTAGDDYELCFTVPAANEAAIQQLSQALHCPLTQIGEIVAGKGLQCVNHQGTLDWVLAGWEHFSPDK